MHIMPETHPVIDIFFSLSSFVVLKSRNVVTEKCLYEDVGCLFAAPNNLLPEGQDLFKEMLS